MRHLFKSSSVHRYLDCFPLLAVVDTVAVCLILIRFACRSIFSKDTGEEMVGLLVTMTRFGGLAKMFFGVPAVDSL